MNFLSAAIARAPNAPGERRVLAASFVDALGTGLFMPLSVIYLTRIVGLSPTQVGMGLSIAGAVAVAAVPVSGALVDRFDARLIVLACFGVSATGFISYLAVDSFPRFLAVAVTLQLASRMERPATAALVLSVASGPEGVGSLAWQQSSRNLGYGIGGLLAGASLLGEGRGPFIALLAVNAASYALAAVLVAGLPAASPQCPGAARASGYATVLRDRSFVALAALNVAMALHDSVLLVAVPLWILTQTTAPVAMTGLLFTLNTVLVVALQVRATRHITASGGLARGYRLAALAFAGCCGAFALASGRSPVAAAVLLAAGLAALTVGELANTAGEWLLSVELAPTPLRGRYLGLFKTSMAAQQALGPLLVTALLVHWGRLGWGVLATVLIAGALASGSLGSVALRRRTHAVSWEHQ